MASFFINRPIVAMVIAIIMVLLGVVSMLQLPIAQFPNIVPPQVQVTASYIGADAQTVEQAVATPLEQQVSGVDNMDYMYSVNANNGAMTLNVFFDMATDPNTDQILTQLRVSQADTQLPTDVRNNGITVKKAQGFPLLIFSVYSPSNTYDNLFLANYATINLADPLTRVPGIASVMIFGAGNYALRFWVKPDQLAKLQITVPDIISAIQKQNTVNPAGQIGGEPVPPGQEFTYAVRAQGRLTTPEEFGAIIVRANADGSMVRLSDVARVELGAQMYGYAGRVNGRPAAIVLVYQLPDSNALDAAKKAKAMMESLKASFPADLDYEVSLDTTLAVTEGIREIVTTLWEAMLLVILVVFIFLQGWRATLIPLLAVPVSLVGTFMLFPLLGFSINTMSLFGLVLAIGLVVDDAIVVVEAVMHHIENGLSPKEATLKAMSEVSGPVVAIALILAAVFVPTAFIPGITGRMYQQFAVTIALSVVISAFNALTLSPALAALLLRPRTRGHGPLQWFYDQFNKVFGRVTNGYVGICHFAIRKTVISLLFLGLVCGGVVFLGNKLPTGFLPDEDQGYLMALVQLPNAASLQRTDAATKQLEAAIGQVPGIADVTSIVGYNMVNGVQTTYNTTFFITLKPWAERRDPSQKARGITMALNKLFSKFSQGVAFAFPPPAIPGIGTAGGFQFILQDRGGHDIDYLAQQTQKFLEAARQRPELAGLNSSLIPTVPQVYVNVDKEKALKQGVPLDAVYQTLQCFMGSAFVNYFNRFGRQWQVYVQAEGEYRTRAEDLAQFYVRNNDGDMVPLSALTSIESRLGPEFTMRYNLYRCAQINGQAAPRFSSDQATAALEEVFAQTMPSDMGFAYAGMSFQEQQARQGIPPAVIFGFSLLCVFLILAAQYESWSLPFSVLLGTPIAVCGALGMLMARLLPNNIYAQIGLVMLIGLAAKNAILIVEFAKMNVEKGQTLIEAALGGARLRLRPILMTSFAFILGCVPLWTADGAGAVSRRILGTAVIGGMLAATCIGTLIIPVTFYIVERLGGKKHAAPPGPPAPPAAVEDKGGAHAPA